MTPSSRICPCFPGNGTGKTDPGYYIIRLSRKSFTSCMKTKWLPLTVQDLIWQHLFGKTKVVARSFQASWYKSWTWLHYLEASDSVICFTCAQAVSYILQKWKEHLLAEPQNAWARIRRSVVLCVCLSVPGIALWRRINLRPRALRLPNFLGNCKKFVSVVSFPSKQIHGRRSQPAEKNLEKNTQAKPPTPSLERRHLYVEKNF